MRFLKIKQKRSVSVKISQNFFFTHGIVSPFFDPLMGGQGGFIECGGGRRGINGSRVEMLGA